MQGEASGPRPPRHSVDQPSQVAVEASIQESPPAEGGASVWVACACCGTTVPPDALYASEQGSVCDACHGAEEARDTLERGDADLAMSTFLLPAWVALALVALGPFSLLFADAPMLWSIIPAVVGFAGVRTAWRGVFEPGVAPRHRAALTAAGISTAVVLWLVAAGMAGLLS